MKFKSSFSSRPTEAGGKISKTLALYKLNVLENREGGEGKVCGVQASYEDSTYHSVNHNSVGNSHFGSLSI